MTMTTKEQQFSLMIGYQRVYSWVRKYHSAADSWEALKDNRGHRKPQKALEEMTEKERLEAEIKRLKKINREMELEIAFTKNISRNTQLGSEATGRYQTVQELINETAGSVSKLTKIAKVSRKSYYQWLKRQPTQREIENQEILEAIYQIEKRHQNCAGIKK